MPILWTSPFSLYCFAWFARAIHPSSLPFLSTWSHRVINGPAPSTLSPSSFEKVLSTRTRASFPALQTPFHSLEFEPASFTLINFACFYYNFSFMKKISPFHQISQFQRSLIRFVRILRFNSANIQANFGKTMISKFHFLFVRPFSAVLRGRRIRGLYARPRITISRLLFPVSLRYPGVPYYIGNVRAESVVP